jgi:hypothetical protein
MILKTLPPDLRISRWWWWKTKVSRIDTKLSGS